jgi:DNA-binding response OmpR family regulator
MTQYASAHILIVDDIPTNLRLAKAFLSTGGYRNIYLESDPTKVVEWLKRVNFNLLILDLSMPQKDGISLFVELQNEFGDHLPPVIFLTALHDDSWRVQAIELGAKAFITKPFDQTKMLSCISEILHSAS